MLFIAVKKNTILFPIMIAVAILFLIGCGSTQELQTVSQKQSPLFKLWKNDSLLKIIQRKKIYLADFSGDPSSYFAEQCEYFFNKLQPQKIFIHPTDSFLRSSNQNVLNDTFMFSTPLHFRTDGTMTGTITRDDISAILFDADYGKNLWSVKIPLIWYPRTSLNQRLRIAAAQLVSTFTDAEFGLYVMEPEWYSKEFRQLHMINDDAGVVVDDYTNNSHAGDAGIEKNDLIIAVDDIFIYDFPTMIASIFNKKPGDIVILSILRDGKKLTKSLQLISRTF